MKLTFIITTALIGAASAFPGRSLGISKLDKRQATANDLSGACKSVFLIFARASTEIGNMGSSMGPAVCSGLKSKLGAGKVGCQGVGGAYAAGLETNILPAGTTEAAIKVAVDHFSKAATKCPEASLVGGGYSQGSALMMNAVSKSSAEVREKIKGVVLFGYTKNAQQKGGIPNYPKDRVKVFCSASDGVCGGALLVTAGHFSYVADGSGTSAVNFLVSKLKG